MSLRAFPEPAAEASREAPGRARGKWPWIAVSLGLLACAALAVDVPIARFARAQPPSPLVRRLLEYGESFGHAMGASLALAAIALVDVRRWNRVPRLAGCAFGAGLLADIVKVSIERVRPAYLPLEAHNALETFGGWWPGFHGSHRFQSFPSAHTSVAVGLAVGLSACYPRGRVVFMTLAGLCAAHRVAFGAHYLSDVLAGAALGCLTAKACLRFTSFHAAETGPAPAADESRDTRRAA